MKAILQISIGSFAFLICLCCWGCFEQQSNTDGNASLGIEFDEDSIGQDHLQQSTAKRVEWKIHTSNGPLHSTTIYLSTSIAQLMNEARELEKMARSDKRDKPRGEFLICQGFDFRKFAPTGTSLEVDTIKPFYRLTTNEPEDFYSLDRIDKTGASFQFHLYFRRYIDHITFNLSISNENLRSDPGVLNSNNGFFINLFEKGENYFINIPHDNFGFNNGNPFASQGIMQLDSNLIVQKIIRVRDHEILYQSTCLYDSSGCFRGEAVKIPLIERKGCPKVKLINSEMQFGEISRLFYAANICFEPIGMIEPKQPYPDKLPLWVRGGNYIPK
jgi:hypothetical protein